MIEKLIKCVVKGPKGLYHEGINHPDGTPLKLQASTVASKRARGNLYLPGEWEGKQAEAAASLEAQEAEEEEEVEVEVEVEAPKSTAATPRPSARVVSEK